MELSLLRQRTQARPSKSLVRLLHCLNKAPTLATSITESCKTWARNTITLGGASGFYTARCKPCRGLLVEYGRFVVDWMRINFYIHKPQGGVLRDKG